MANVKFNDIINSVNQLSLHEKQKLMDKLSNDEELWRERMRILQKKIGIEAKKMGLDKLTMEEINTFVHKSRATEYQ